MAERSSKVLLGFGVATIAILLRPPHNSARVRTAPEESPELPTARQPKKSQETALSTSPLSPTFTLGMTDQDRPFHRSTSVSLVPGFSVKYPTAAQSVAVTQLTS